MFTCKFELEIEIWKPKQAQVMGTLNTKFADLGIIFCLMAGTFGFGHDWLGEGAFEELL
ncbi:hypothetical protein PRUPE_1G578300 [Prunus persica]|uniref:Uncharacterized protein n=1 Tax=Prunus persica TaxID=3760 RepID=A0A251RJV8_PRUPE|nr:hypothetical protein PRUPE_1G578300 [Prunus persica]